MFAIFISLIFSFLHPHFVSVSHIHYNEKSRLLEITHQINAEDLESALSYHFGKKVKISSDSSQQNSMEYISEYWHQHFAIDINEKSCDIDYLGFETDGDHIILFAEAAIDQPYKVKIKASFLTEILPGQINIFHVSILSQKKSFKLKKKNSVKEWKLGD